MHGLHRGPIRQNERTEVLYSAAEVKQQTAAVTTAGDT